MKNIKIYILLIIAVTLISSIYVFLKVDDDDIKYDARLTNYLLSNKFL